MNQIVGGLPGEFERIQVNSPTKGIQPSDLERWQQAGYAAVDQLVVQLKDQIEGKDVEEISNLLREEGKKLTAALFEQMINSLGKEEL